MYQITNKTHTMNTYRIISERKPENIYRDQTETFTITAKNLREAISLARRECRWRDVKFVNAKRTRN